MPPQLRRSHHPKSRPPARCEGGRADVTVTCLASPLVRVSRRSSLITLLCAARVAGWSPAVAAAAFQERSTRRPHCIHGGTHRDRWWVHFCQSHAVRPHPLRAEFVIAGLAFLLSTLWFVHAVDERRGGDGVDILRWLNKNDIDDYEFLALAVAIGLAYLAGVLIVQVSFWRPTVPLIENIRQSRLKELRDLRERIEKTPDADAAYRVILEMAFAPREYDLAPIQRSAARRLGLKRVFPLNLPQPQAHLRNVETLALTIGRSFGNDELGREYEYRRSNRQIFIGVLPSVALAGVAATLEWWEQPWGPIVPFAVLPLLFVLWRSARYQEKVAQSLLLDRAFVELWAQATDLVADLETRQPVTTFDADVPLRGRRLLSCLRICRRRDSGEGEPRE
jgi:hypothetical protein